MTWIASVWVRCSKPMKYKSWAELLIYLRFPDNGVNSSPALHNYHLIVFESTIKWKWKR